MKTWVVPATPTRAVNIIGYKIRRRSDGLYSTGGGNPGWRQAGKTWAGLNQLHNHFAVVQEIQGYSHRRHARDPEPDFVAQVYADCDIVVLAEVGTEDLRTHQSKRTRKV